MSWMSDGADSAHEQHDEAICFNNWTHPVVSHVHSKLINYAEASTFDCEHIVLEP